MKCEGLKNPKQFYFLNDTNTACINRKAEIEFRLS